MFFKNINRLLKIKNHRFLYNQKIFHITQSKPPPRRIFFYVKWDKDFKYYQFIEKKLI